ncbi:MAG: CheA signal transduction histidine kinase, partial [Caulobacteraceae bacterium]|nr:CheA signal transduction histidine kinase [Caulobacteraceae bacterium]
MDPLAAIKETFFQECEEQLAELESGLLAVEEGDHDPERINAVFRAVHSVKGGAGAFGLEPLVRFAHVFETALDQMRSGGLAPEDHVLKVMLRAADVLADHVVAARGGPAVDEARSTLIAEELAQLTGDDGAGDDEDFDIAFQPLGFDLELPGAGAMDLAGLPELPSLDAPAASHAWSVTLKPFGELYSHGNEAGLLLRELRRLGELELTLDSTALPTLEAMDPAEGYLSWSAVLTTEAGEESVREVFEFVDGHCELDIRAAEPAEPPIADLPTLDLPTLDAELPAAAAPASEAPADLDIAALIRQAQSAVQELLTD